MKKYFIILILMVTTASYAVSQSPTFGVQAGITLANEKAKFENTSEKNDSKIGFTAVYRLSSFLIKVLVHLMMMPLQLRQAHWN